MNFKNMLLLFPAFVLLTATTASADICTELFTYEDGQIMNNVDDNKARVISKFTLDSKAFAKGAIKKQVLNSLSEYGDYKNDDFTKAVKDTDEGSVLVTIAQSKKTKRLYTIIQFFMGDTESGNIFSLYSSSKLAELGDGECR